MLDVIFEDNEILVINKPSGLIVNKSETAKGRTLQDMLEEDLPVFRAVGEEDSEFFERSGIVHRLDKDTSGVVVIAKTPEAFDNLKNQFKERETEKEYIALVHGVIEEELIEINAPIKRSPINPMKFAVVSGGRSAITKIEKVGVVENEYTFLKAFPKTGRTHQIRVHLTSINHPVVGDTIYCSKLLLEKDLKTFKRMMLHARFLTIQHPATKEPMTFEAPLPEVFDLVLARL